MMEIIEKKDDGRQRVILIVMSSFSVISILAVAFLAWYIFDTRNNLSLVKENSENESPVLENSGDNLNPSENNFNGDLSAEEVIKRVSKHMLLSEGDITVATVTNLKGLRDDFPDLFQYAKYGDKLIFYSLGIIIYDPVLDKVVDVLRRFPNDVVIPRSPEEKI